MQHFGNIISSSFIMYITFFGAIEGKSVFCVSHEDL